MLVRRSVGVGSLVALRPYTGAWHCEWQRGGDLAEAGRATVVETGIFSNGPSIVSRMIPLGLTSISN